MIKIAVILFSLVFAGSLFAVDLKYVVPSESKLIPEEHKHLPSVLFRGDINLSGTFEIGKIENSDARSVSLNFYPDAGSVSKLPYIPGHEPNRIQIRNSEEILSQLIASDLRNRLASGEIDAVIGRVEFTINPFFASSVCDYTGYEAKVTDVRKLKELEIADIKVNKYGC